jgi:uncharacterized membrane protein
MHLLAPYALEAHLSPLLTAPPPVLVLGGGWGIHFPNDLSTNLAIGLRLAHFLAGITWVGLGYFFVLVGARWLRDLDAGVRRQAAPPLMQAAMWWFRWSSVVTVLAGLGLWMMEVGADHRAAGEVHSNLIWSYFVLWTLAYIIYMGILMIPTDLFQRGPILAVVTAGLVIVTSWLFLRVNSHGWETNRVLAIGIGGGIGWFMMFNVWGIIWRFQKRLIRWTAEGTMPPEAARMARLASLAARTNAWLSLPMLFFMGAASHYPLFGGLG